MTIDIRIDDPLCPDGLKIIEKSEILMRSLFKPEECFTFSPSELANPETNFYIARHNDVPIGCVALVRYDGYGEIKRLYVDDAARGLGLGRKLMDRLEHDAIADEVNLVRLETAAKLKSAVSLYSSMGYKTRTSYGDYPDDNNSLFMEKHL